MNFGDRLRQLRNEKGLTLRELEKETGITFSSLGKYERNEREPDFDTLETLASYFGVMIDWLLGRIETRTFDEYVFINDVRHLEEKLKSMDSEKRKHVVNAIDHLYLILNSHLDDESPDALEIIFEIIYNLFWFDNGFPTPSSHKRVNKNNQEDILNFLSTHKNQFNTLLDELFKIRLKTHKSTDFLDEDEDS